MSQDAQRDGYGMGWDEIEDLAQTQMDFSIRLMEVIPAPAVSRAFELYERFASLRLKNGMTWCSFEEFANRVFARGLAAISEAISEAEAIQKQIENG